MGRGEGGGGEGGVREGGGAELGRGCNTIKRFKSSKKPADR